MQKTLLISIKDFNDDEQMTIAGTLEEKQFNKAIVLSIGQSKIVVDSQILAQALSEVVTFQKPSKVENEQQ
jgi:hypothetical protein